MIDMSYCAATSVFNNKRILIIYRFQIFYFGDVWAHQLWSHLGKNVHLVNGMIMHYVYAKTTEWDTLSSDDRLNQNCIIDSVTDKA